MDFDRIVDYFQGGKITQTPRLIPGGKVNQVWKIHTDKKSYALKRIVNSPVSLSCYRQVETIALQFQEKGLPVVTANRVNDDPIGTIDQDDFMLFDWVEGEVVTPEKIEPQHAEKIGAVLARMHGINASSSNIDLSVLNDTFYSFEFSEARWWALLDQAAIKKMKCADQCRINLSLIIEASEQANQSLSRLKSKPIISHRDMSPNNIVWKKNGTPMIIDWELAGLIHPSVDVMGMAFDWSLLKPHEINEHYFQTLIQAYCEAGGDVVEIFDAFYVVMGVWLSWMEFNIRRFVETKTLAQRALGEREAMFTLLALGHVFPQQARWVNLVSGSQK